MQSVAEVQEEIARYYGDGRVPPAVFVEWRMSAPIEIELVAWGGPVSDASELLEFITPPDVKASPLFSRVARINRGGTIYFGDLAGRPAATAAEQAEQPFEQLELLLEKTGSDFKHLAKATYYVTDDEVSKAHNAIRPKYYDPARPPAASKAVVAATGRPGSQYVMDMIAVPSSRGTPASGPEHGLGLSAEEAAAGWISLFDGQTTFGWKDARADGGLLRGGETTTRFGNCQVRGQFASAGTITVGGREYSVSPDKPLAIDKTGQSGPIRLGEGLAVKSLAVRPLDLELLMNGRDLSGWKSIERTGPTDGANQFWRAENGVLRAVGGPGAIEYAGGLLRDLMLQIDVRSRAVHSNGGVFIRSVPGQFMNGYEIQLHNRCLDDDPARTYRYATGGIDDRQDARRLVSRDFATFRMTIIADGPHLASWVNGVQLADWTDDRPPHENPREGQRLAPGSLQLQAHDPATDFEVRQLLAAPLK
jgi:enamine deaminase RidA (YjgF/YER057c/UK114 family)